MGLGSVDAIGGKRYFKLNLGVKSGINLNDLLCIWLSSAYAKSRPSRYVGFFYKSRHWNKLSLDYTKWCLECNLIGVF